MNHVSAIVLAAGRGVRFASGKQKLLVNIGSKPAYYYSLDVLSRHPSIKDIIIVANRKNKESICRGLRRYRIGKISAVVLGGRERKDSAINGLRALSPSCGIVLIHDAARPLIDKKIVSDVIGAARKFKAAIVAVPVKATIKAVKNLEPRTKNLAIINKTLPRDVLWEAQTPQAFRREIIEKAYRRYGSLKATDDAMMAERLGIKVRIVEGSYRNIKITTREDLLTARAMLRKG